MTELGLVAGSAGNISRRVGSVIYITPSGVPYDYLRPQMIILLDFDGNVLSRGGEPSSEWRMHVLIYREFPEVHAMVHTHSPHATAIAVHGSLRPVSDEGRLRFGDEVPVSRQAPPGTWELACATVEALKQGKGACLLARHGAVTVGWTLTDALRRAVALEEEARVVSWCAGVRAQREG